MKLFKKLIVIAALVGCVPVSFAAPKAAVVEVPVPEFFTAKGKITQLNAEEKVLHVKLEAGLEVTFHADDKTLIKAGETTKSFADLAADDPVMIEYVYNGDYEKVAKTITKPPKSDSTSAEKNPAPGA